MGIEMAEIAFLEPLTGNDEFDQLVADFAKEEIRGTHRGRPALLPATPHRTIDPRQGPAHDGRTGLLAIKPFMRMSQKDLWQFYMLAN